MTEMFVFCPNDAQKKDVLRMLSRFARYLDLLISKHRTYYWNIPLCVFKPDPA